MIRYLYCLLILSLLQSCSGNAQAECANIILHSNIILEEAYEISFPLPNQMSKDTSGENEFCLTGYCYSSKGYAFNIHFSRKDSSTTIAKVAALVLHSGSLYYKEEKEIESFHKMRDMYFQVSNFEGSNGRCIQIRGIKEVKHNMYLRFSLIIKKTLDSDCILFLKESLLEMDVSILNDEGPFYYVL